MKSQSTLRPPPGRQYVVTRSISHLTLSSQSQKGEINQSQVQKLWDQEQLSYENVLPENENIQEAYSLIQRLRINQALDILKAEVEQSYMYLGTHTHFQLVSQIVQMLTSSAMALLQAQPSSALLLLLGGEQLIKTLTPKQQGSLRVQLLNGLSCYYRRTEQIDKALAELEKALSEIKKYRIKEVSVTHLNLSVVLSAVGEHDGALENAKKAVIVSHKQYQSMSQDGIDGPKFQRCVSTLAISFYNVAVQEHHHQRYQLALQAYASGYKISEDHLGSSHPLTIQLKGAYEEFARELALAEAQKLSIQTLKNTKQRSFKQRPPSAAYTQKIMLTQSQISSSQRQFKGRPSSGFKYPIQSEKSEKMNSQVVLSDSNLGGVFNSRVRPKSAAYQSTSKLNRVGNILGQQSSRVENFNIRRTNLSKNNFFSQDESGLVKNHTMLSEELMLLKQVQQFQIIKQAEEERQKLEELRLRREEEARKLEQIKESQKTLLEQQRHVRIVEKSPKQQVTLELTPKKSTQDIQKESAVMIQNFWRNKQFKFRQSVFRRHKGKINLIDADYLKINTNQRIPHDGFVWFWFDSKNCVAKIYFIDLQVARKSVKKPNKQNKFDHEASVYMHFEKSFLMDRFSKNNDYKYLEKSQELREFMDIIYRKLRSKMRLTFKVDKQKWFLSVDLKEFIAILYQEKYSIKLVHKWDIIFVKSNYKLKNHQLQIAQTQSAIKIQRYIRHKLNQIPEQIEVKEETGAINMKQVFTEITDEKMTVKDYTPVSNLDEKFANNIMQGVYMQATLTIQQNIRSIVNRMRTKTKCRKAKQIVFKKYVDGYYFFVQQTSICLKLYVCQMKKNIKYRAFRAKMIIDNLQLQQLKESPNALQLISFYEDSITWRQEEPARPMISIIPDTEDEDDGHKQLVIKKIDDTLDRNPFEDSIISSTEDNKQPFIAEKTTEEPNQQQFNNQMLIQDEQEIEDVVEEQEIKNPEVRQSIDQQFEEQYEDKFEEFKVESEVFQDNVESLIKRYSIYVEQIKLIQKFIRSWLICCRQRKLKQVKVLQFTKVQSFKTVITLHSLGQNRILEISDYISPRKENKLQIHKKINIEEAEMLLNATNILQKIYIDEGLKDFVFVHSERQHLSKLQDLELDSLRSQNNSRIENMLLDYEGYDENSDKFQPIGNIKAIKDKVILKIVIEFDEPNRSFRAVYEDLKFQFRIHNYEKVVKTPAKYLKAIIFNESNGSEVLRVYTTEHEKACINVQRYFKLIHYQRKFKVKIPRQNQSGDLYVGRRRKTNTIYLALTTSKGDKRNFYKFPGENYRQFIAKIQFRIMSNLKYSEEDGIYLLQEPEHKIIAQNTNAKIFSYEGQRFEFHGTGLLNAIYDASGRKLLIASDDRKTEAVSVDIPTQLKQKSEIVNFAEGLLQRSFIITSHEQPFVIYYEDKDEQAVKKIQRKFKQVQTLRGFNLQANYFQNNRQQTCSLQIELVSRFFCDFSIRITQNETVSDFNIGKLDRETRKLFIMNLRRFCSLFINFGPEKSTVDVEGLLYYFNAPFDDLDLHNMEDEIIRSEQENKKFMAD